MHIETKRNLLTLGLAAMLALVLGLERASAALNPYYGIAQNTAAGRAAGHISGTWGVASSSQNPSGYTVFLDGTNGRVGIGTANPSYPLDLGGYGVLRSSAAVYGTLGIGYEYSSLFTGAKLNINAQNGYAIAIHPIAGVNGYYLYPGADDFYIRTTGGDSNTRRLVLGNSGSTHGGLSLNVYGGPQNTYPGIALRGSDLGAAISAQNGDTTGNRGGFKLYAANANGGLRLQTWQSDAGSSADRLIVTQDNGWFGFGAASNAEVLSLVHISSGSLRLAGSGAKIIFPDGSEQSSAAVPPSGYAQLAGTQTFSGLNDFAHRVAVSSDVVVSGGITFSDGSRQTTAGGGGGGNTVSSGGLAGYLPKFSSATEITASAVSDSGAGVTFASSATVNGAARITGELALTGVSGYQRKNLIINGDFDLFQRRLSTQTPSGSASVYVADRFKYVQNSDAALYISSSSAVPALALTGHKSYSSLQHYVTTPDSSIGSYQYAYIEYVLTGFDARRLMGRTVTLSFVARSSVAGTYTVTFRNADSWLASANPRTYPATYSIASAGVDQLVTISVAIPDESSGWSFTPSGRGLMLDFVLAAGDSASIVTSNTNQWNNDSKFAANTQANALATAGNVFRLSQVQLEIGAVKTGFEERTLQQELELAQHFYEKSYNLSVAPGSGATGYVATLPLTAYVLPSVQFRSRKITAPAVTLYSTTGTSGAARDITSGSDITGFTAVPVDEMTFVPYRAAGGITTANWHGFAWTADADF